MAAPWEDTPMAVTPLDNGDTTMARKGKPERRVRFPTGLPCARL